MKLRPLLSLSQVVLGLLEGRDRAGKARVKGIIEVLNETCLQSSTNAAFVEQLREEGSHFAAHARLSRPRDKSKVLFFSVRHYADTVEYCAADWVDKNQDNVSSTTRSLMSLSRNKILLTIFSAQRDDGGAGRDRSKSYLASKFREQLRSLLGTIQKTQVQYVRCVKPNMAKSPAEFDMFKVVEQLRCAGVIEAIRITRARFPDKMPHALLCQRFGV